MEPVFTIAKYEDLPRIVETYNATVPGRMVTADTEPVTTAQKKAWFESHDSERRPLWVIHSEGKYCGWMSFSSFYGRPAYNGTVEVSIYLNSDAQGRGLGRKCLEKAFASAPQLNIHTLLGFIFGHNEPSIRLFIKNGFQVWGTLPAVAVLDGIPRDLLILGKKV